MTSQSEPLLRALNQAKNALKRGNVREARKLAELALQYSPKNEEAWLILAAVASPRASLFYAGQALEINPSSKRARKGLNWAIKRARANGISVISLIDSKPASKPIPGENFLRILVPIIGLLIFAVLFLIGYGAIRVYSISIQDNQESMAFRNGEPGVDAQLSPTNDRTRSATSTIFLPATNTILPSATILPTETSTQFLTPSSTPSPTYTQTIFSPSPELESTASSNQASQRPKNVSNDEFWIDVDLSQQKLYAYFGDQLLKVFIVSTGLKSTPTVTGQFRIYVKYRYANMTGPGYYLANVPYVMYFFDDYGLHGTYWHDNFGQRMSHGCVNLRTQDAGWIYKNSVVGTVVNIHR